MGLFPHDAPPARITPRNPAGADGFESVGHAHPRPGTPRAPLPATGFAPAAWPASEAITFRRQGGVDRSADEGREPAATRPASPSPADLWRRAARAGHRDRKDEEGRHP